eukprot:767165_1
MNPFQSAFPTVIAIAIYTAFMRHVQSQSAGATTSTTNAPITKYSTIIMGAGMSGISAAKTLYDAGERNFIVLEAQDYIGGRTKTVEFGGLSGLNVGCSWFTGGCHDSSTVDCTYWSGIAPTETNPLFTLAIQNGYTFVNTKWSDQTALGANGVDETSKYRTAEGALGVVWECIYDMGATVTANISLSEALDKCGWDATDSVSKSVEFNWFEWGNAINFDLISADVLTVTSKELYGNQDLFVTDPRGFEGITKLVAIDFVDKIRLNAPVKTIAYDANNGVTVTLDNGEILSADYGIITFSLGVLQSDLVTFSPPVPTWKSNAWNTFGMSHFSPILIKWPYDFWSATAGTKWWYVLNDDRFGYYVNVMNSGHPDLYQDSLIWRIDLVADVSISVQKQDIAQIQADIVTKVSLYFDNVPQPDDIIIQKWSENVYIRGSYMYWPPKSTLADQEEVKRNIDGVLYFAGEHTVPDNGYVHSAYYSGINVAEEVLQSMSTSTQTPTQNPTKRPTPNPNQIQTERPTQNPNQIQTERPTQNPNQFPTGLPTQNPNQIPTGSTNKPTNNPIQAGSLTSKPTEYPTLNPITLPYSTTDTSANGGKKPKREAATSQMMERIDDSMLWIIIAVVAIVLCCFCIVCMYLWRRKQQSMRFDELQDDDDDIL